MRRAPSLLLTLAAVACVASIPARAQTAEPVTAPVAAATTDAKAEDTVEKKKDEDKKPALNARLAPGGVLAGGDVDSFPLHLTATLDNSFGTGFYAKGVGSTDIPILGGETLHIDAPNVPNEPSWSSSLSLRPAVSIPKIDGLPKMLMSTSIDFFLNNWLAAYGNSGVYERQVRVSDLGVGFILPGIFTEEFTGISATPVISARVPLSITSRQQNLFTSVGASVQLAWNSPETPVGQFSLQFSPSLRGSLYTQDATSIPCDAAVTVPGNFTALDSIELPLQYSRSAEILSNGECRLVGRQGLASIATNGAASWSAGDHNVALSLGWGMGFLRGLRDAPELRGLYASGQNFNETSNGSVSYTYTVPVDFQLFLTAGVGSGQPVFTPTGGVRFPFFDFVTPRNNISSAFFDVSVGI